MNMPSRTRLIVLLLLALLLIGLISFAGAKYVTTITHHATITFSASLAENVILQEHKAVRQTDGSYALVTQKYANDFPDDEYSAETFVHENSYTLIPGLDIPKDPKITILNKTPIKAFLFLEVVETVNEEAIVFQVDDNWWKKTDLKPKHDGGVVYYYSTDKTNAVVLDEKITNPLTVPILSQETIRVSQNVLSSLSKDAQVLTFHVYLIEKMSDTSTPEGAYYGYPPNT